MGDPLGFFNIHSVAKHQKIGGGPFGGKLFLEKKSHNAKKTERETFSLSRYSLRGNRRQF